MFFTYVLTLSNGSYYVGQTNDLDSRVHRHQTGQVKSTSRYLPAKLVYYETFSSRSESMRRERQLKSWKSHKAISDLINNGPVV